jgi:hypothetical protein
MAWGAHWLLFFGLRRILYEPFIHVTVPPVKRLYLEIRVFVRPFEYQISKHGLTSLACIWRESRAKEIKIDDICGIYYFSLPYGKYPSARFCTIITKVAAEHKSRGSR